jgi:hypothetical protein
VDSLNHAAEAERLPGQAELGLDPGIDANRKALIGLNAASSETQVFDAPEHN